MIKFPTKTIILIVRWQKKRENQVCLRHSDKRKWKFFNTWHQSYQWHQTLWKHWVNTCKSTLSPLNASLNCVSIFFSESTSIDAPTNRNETRALRAKKLFHFFCCLIMILFLWNSLTNSRRQHHRPELYLFSKYL